MNSGSEGYVAGLEYNHEYQPELNPARLKLHFTAAGLIPPKIAAVCELGFGQGLSSNVHAAASTARWFATDFNTAQTGYARELAQASGAAAHFHDQSFAEFCSRPDLPDFDFIALHGIWSWVSDANRGVIVDFLRRKLKAGGAVYISYNTLPGHAELLPMQDLLARHAESMSPPGLDLRQRIEPAIEFAQELLALSPPFANAHPQVAERLRMIGLEERNYVAHEYFNRNWLPTSFARMSEWLGQAKLEYACSANYFNMVDDWNFTAEQLEFLRAIPEPALRESARDVMTNQKFRKDYWVKGARHMTEPEKVESICRERVVMIRPRHEVSLKILGARGELTFLDAVCGPILATAADHVPKSLGQIARAVEDRGLSLSQVVEVVLALVETGGMAAVQDDEVIRAARGQTDRLNVFLCDKSRVRPNTPHLVSPVTGGGLIDIGVVAQFFCQAVREGKRQPAELAANAFQILQAQDITIFKDGKPLEPDENLAIFTTQAVSFMETQLPILKALQIV